MRIIPASPPAARPAAPGTSPPAAAAAPPPAAQPVMPAPRHRPGSELEDAPETAKALLAAWSGDPLIIIPSPPGAGKTRLVVLLAAALAEQAGMRVGVAAQTRAQAAQIARRTGAHTLRATLMWARGQPFPDTGPVPAVTGNGAGFPGSAGGILIGTTARWTRSEPLSIACDLMLVDEAWQATYADVCALGAFATQIVCVGDPGQIDPVVTGAVTRWDNDPQGPHLPAPSALADAHPAAVTWIRLPDTWRLGPATTRLIQPAYYPAMPFGSRRPDEHVAGPAGPLPEIAWRPARTTRGPADPALARACAARAAELLTSHRLITPGGSRPLDPGDISVVTPHVSQASAVRALLAGTGVHVGTANQLQGQEYPAVIALHPLAGYRDPAGADFVTDPGRACVALSRHRSHLTVIIDPQSAAIPGAERTLLTRVMTEPEL